MASRVSLLSHYCRGGSSAGAACRRVATTTHQAAQGVFCGALEYFLGGVLPDDRLMIEQQSQKHRVKKVSDSSTHQQTQQQQQWKSSGSSGGTTSCSTISSSRRPNKAAAAARLVDGRAECERELAEHLLLVLGPLVVVLVGGREGRRSQKKEDERQHT